MEPKLKRPLGNILAYFSPFTVQKASWKGVTVGMDEDKLQMPLQTFLNKTWEDGGN